MNTFSKLLISSAALCVAAAASAGTAMHAADSSKITNGGTGYIGLTESAGQPRTFAMGSRADARMDSRLPSQAGEASTFVNGIPNGNPDAPTAMGSPRASTSTMGNMASGTQTWIATHRSWGTPD